MPITLTNSLTRRKEVYTPLKPGKVGMYVCGPTVYERPHLGNARAVVVYDMLYRILCHEYGQENINYVRNITDVDDKINAAAKVNNEPISTLTKRVTQWFQEDMAALNCLNPNHEPRATDHMNEIIALIAQIIANGHAYLSEGHVLFDIQSAPKWDDYAYGDLSGKKLEDLQAGARITVESYKRSDGDFVLWKPANEGDDSSSVFNSPWGQGRPGWHIECSAMSTRYLGENFDIHGGGADLKFPHHENEIIQSRCGNTSSSYANYWIHNGFLTINGEKMSKSLGNFTTVRELLDKGVEGEAIRLLFLGTHYRKPLDFSDHAVAEAQKKLKIFQDAAQPANSNHGGHTSGKPGGERSPEPAQAALHEKASRLSREQSKKNAPENEAQSMRIHAAYERFLNALYDDMNTPLALSELYTMAKSVRSLNSGAEDAALFRKAANLLGLLEKQPESKANTIPEEILTLAEARKAAKAAKDYAKADAIRAQISDAGFALKDNPDGSTEIMKKT